MEKRSLVKLPTEQALVLQIRQALDEVSVVEWNNITFVAIASALAKRLKQDPNIYCYWRASAGKREHCDGREFMFDFCALLYEKADLDFLVQALVVGETEWDREETDDDFEKLLLVDAIVCFFVFEEDSELKADEKLNRYTDAIKVKQEYARVRGGYPPKFLLACYLKPHSGTKRSHVLAREV